MLYKQILNDWLADQEIYKKGGTYTQTLNDANLPLAFTLRTQLSATETISYSPWQSGSVASGNFVNSSLYDLGREYSRPIDIKNPYKAVYFWHRIN